MSHSLAEYPPGAVAIIGMACRLPGANSPEQYWRNLRSGVESITFFTEEEIEAAQMRGEECRAPGFVAAKGVVDRADTFDAGFFGFTPRDAGLTDPQHRLFLECAWEALENAGYEPKNYSGNIGVFAGSILSSYLLNNLWPNGRLVGSAGAMQLAIGNDSTFLASRTSYELDLRGPSVSVGTACSTSLVAVHVACQSLMSSECDMALAGGISIHVPLVSGYRYTDGGILSPDGHCRPFDAAAAGTVSSDGAGIVVLKRLADAIADGDFVYAVIRGSAINNDGNLKVGYTAPSVSGQARVVAEAMAISEVDPRTVSMVETHGAGTLLGDPIEVAALLEAFGPCEGARGFCALSSVKSNIGHVDAAAGIAGLIKAALAVHHGEVPPTLYYRSPNPQIAMKDSPFYVNSELKPMRRNGAPLRAGVSSFGIGGTNVHVVIEEPPPAPEVRSPRRPYDLLLLSARTSAALDAATGRLADFLEEARDSDFADVCFTLRHGRRAFLHRRALACNGAAEAVGMLRGRDPQALQTSAAGLDSPELVFLFPGLGDHYSGMGWELYCAEPTFRGTVNRCAEILNRHLEQDIRDFLYPGRNWARPVLEVEPASAAAKPEIDLRAMLGRRKPAARKEGTPGDLPGVAQPGIFVTEVALAELLQSWGFRPAAMIGHSIGEFAAAYASGVLPLEEILELVAARARLIESRVGPGAMLATPLPRAELIDLLPSGVSLAANNGFRLTIASGEEAGIRELEALLAQRGVSCQRLPSTHAYHSRMMEPIAEPLAAVARRFRFQRPRIPYISCVTGTWITDEQATDPEYWSHHLSHTVCFQEGLAELLSDPRRILLEVGPGQGLTAHAVTERARVPGRTNPVIPTMRWSYGLQSEFSVLLRGVGSLWLAGAAFDSGALLAREDQRRVPLPTYPFERERYWIDPPNAGAALACRPASLKNSDVTQWFYLPSWKPSVRRQSVSRSQGSWLIFADEFGAGEELAREIRGSGAKVFTVTPGDNFVAEGDAFRIDPRSSKDYEALVSALSERQSVPATVVHLWNLTRAFNESPSSARFRALQETGFYSLIRLIRVLGARKAGDVLRVEIGANHLFEVSGEEELVPEKATLCAPAMVAPQEYPNLTCRIIDTDIPPDDPARRSRLARQLLDEIRSEPCDPVVSYRRGRRWVQTYEPVQLPAPAADRIPLRHQGVYLITGGLGGVGLVLARYLAETVQARLVLVGRSAFPGREEWTRWLTEHPANDGTSRRIQQLLALEDLGAKLLVLQGDVSDYGAMGHVFETADAVFGQIHGVIHAAGSVGIQAFREIREATTEDAEGQFVSKVYGLLVLGQLTEGRKLDFCSLTSSLSAILGGLGFAAYAAGNLFMDAFARWKSRISVVPWTSIDWDSWQLSDVRPLIAGLGATVNEFVMRPDEGASAFERVLAEESLPQVVVSSGDLQARLRQWIGRQSARQAAGPIARHERPGLATPYVAPRGEIEQTLAEIWQELFGLVQVGINDNFFELGGHSLLATQLNARLYDRLRVEMSLASLLRAPTIAELATAIVHVQAQNTDEGELERLLAEVDGLSAGDIQSLLDTSTASSSGNP